MGDSVRLLNRLQRLMSTRIAEGNYTLLTLDEIKQIAHEKFPDQKFSAQDLDKIQQDSGHPECQSCHYTENWTPSTKQCCACPDILLTNTGYRVPTYLVHIEIESWFLKPLCKDCLELSS